MSDIPDATNFFGTVVTELSREVVARAFVAAGWAHRKRGLDEHELSSEFAELVLDGADPLLLHGPVADVRENAGRIADVLRGCANELQVGVLRSRRRTARGALGLSASYLVRFPRSAG